MSKTSNLYLQMQQENDALKQTVVDLKKKIDLQEKEILAHYAMADAVKNFCINALEAQGKGWSVWLKGLIELIQTGLTSTKTLDEVEAKYAEEEKKKRKQYLDINDGASKKIKA